MIEVCGATLAELAGLLPRDTRNAGEVTEITDGFLAFEGDRLIACGGFARMKGRLWAFFDVLAAPGSRMGLVHAVRRYLEACGEDVFVPCNRSHASAERFLSVLGFEPTSEIHNGMWVWQWRK